jgi:hypothetical protein
MDEGQGDPIGRGSAATAVPCAVEEHAPTAEAVER